MPRAKKKPPVSANVGVAVQSGLITGQVLATQLPPKASPWVMLGLGVAQAIVGALSGSVVLSTKPKS